MPTSLGAAAFLQKKKETQIVAPGTWWLVCWVLVTSEKSKKDFGGVFFE